MGRGFKTPCPTLPPRWGLVLQQERETIPPPASPPPRPVKSNFQLMGQVRVTGTLVTAGCNGLGIVNIGSGEAPRTAGGVRGRESRVSRGGLGFSYSTVSHLILGGMGWIGGALV